MDDPVAAVASLQAVPAAHTACLPAAPLPPEFRRVQAHVIWRHGEKSFGTERGKHFPSYPLELPQDEDLTEQGRRRMRHLGAQLACELDELGVAPGEDVRLFSCKPAGGRHWESLREVVSSFWPQTTTSLEEMDVQVSGPLAIQTADLETAWASWRLAHGAEESLAAQSPAVAKLIAEARQVLGEKWWPGKRDGPMHKLCIRFAYAMQHGERLPEGVSAQTYHDVSRACHVEDFDFFEQEVPARLLLGKFFASLVRDGRQALDGIKVPRLFLYSSHDYALGPLAAALRAPFGAWPDVGSFIMIDILQRTDTKEAFVRLTRNSNIMPNVLGTSAKDGLVPWSDFVQGVNPLSLDTGPEGAEGRPEVMPQSEEHRFEGGAAKRSRASL